MQNYIYIETYGCSANQNNSEIIKGLLSQANYQITNYPDIADILILNACIVKEKTESKIKRRMYDLAKLYPKKLMIISGCMPETDYNSLKKINSKAIFLGIKHVKDIVKLINDYKEKKLTGKLQKEYLNKRNEEKIFLPKISNNKLISITQISEGCLGNCNFCNVKLAKGKLFSYSRDKILQSIESDLKNGAKELWITSQDNASYGLDKSKFELPELLNNILNLKHNFKLRLGMMNPNNLFQVLNEMLDIYKNPKVYKFLHIPIQSASNKILEDMNRPYQIEQVESTIIKFKNFFTDITIATDIITGYPTETEEDHKKNMEFLRVHKPDTLNLSKFSSHKNTEARKLKPLPVEIINKRAAELMSLHRETAQENKQKYKDKTIPVIVNKKTNIPNFYEARDGNYNIVLINSKNKSILGKRIKVKIIRTGVHELFAELFPL